MSTLTGAYAVNALDEAEREEFEQHLAECAHCAQEVRELQATVAELAAEPATGPPDRLKQRVLDEVTRTPQDPPDHQEPGPRERVTSLGRHRAQRSQRAGRPSTSRLTAAAAAAAIVLAAALGGVAIYSQQQLTEAEQRAEQAQAVNAEMAEIMHAPDAAVTSSAADGATATVVASREMGRTAFLGEDLPGVAEDETYQLWTIGPDGPDSGGLLDRDEHGTIQPQVTDLPEQADQVAVTVEPAGGSEEPTTDPVMAMELET